MNERIIGVGLLTQQNVDQMGSTLERVWLVDDVPCFFGLLQAIDEADREYWRSRDAAEDRPPGP